MSSPSPSKEHIATFHTHFGALSFHRKLKALGLPFDHAWADEDLEAVYLHEEGDYRLLFENEET